jgi:signal transduction histidine kinase
MPGPVCAVDREGRIIYANPSMASLCGGRSPGDCMGKPARVVLESLPFEIQDALFSALREGKRVNVRSSLTGNVKERVVLEGEVFPITSPGEKLPSAAAWTAMVMQDGVPSREALAIEASRRKAKDLLSVVRHDILNQLTILIGFLQFSEDFIQDPTLRDFLGKEETAGQIIQALIEFTRDFQDLAVEDPRWMPLSSLVRSAQERTDPGNVRIEVQVGSIEIFSPPVLRHVFFTLLKNALDHAHGLTRVTISQVEENGSLLLVCEDDGPGIPEGKKRALFERGHGRNRGYSLWLSKEILSIIGASLQETGREGAGARFEIRVPEGMWRGGT